MNKQERTQAAIYVINLLFAAVGRHILCGSQFFIVNVLLLYLPWSADMEGFVYSQNGLALYAATAVVMIPLFLTTVIRPLGEYIQKIEPENMRRESIRRKRDHERQRPVSM